MTTKTLTADGDHLEIGYQPAGYHTSTLGPTAVARIRIESLDRNGTPNWGLTLTAADALEIANILETFAANITDAALAAADTAKADKAEAHRDAEALAASDPFAGITDVKTNDPWDAS